jgi:outer membrane protein, heavy metal efflux system
MKPPVTLAFLLSAASATLALAQPAAPTLLEAVARAPALTAAAQRHHAASTRLESAGRLPDPQIEGMASRVSGPMGEKNSMWELTLRQPLPKRGERAADRELVQAGASMVAADHALLAGELATDAAMAIAEHHGANARAALIDTQLTRLHAVLQSIDGRLAAGTTDRIAERLTVESRRATLQLMLAQEQQMAANAAASIRGRLGLAPDIALPAYAAPAPADIDPTSAPALLAARARAAEAAALGNMARASARPMTAVGLRLTREATAMGNEDIVGLAFMSDLPWRSRQSARTDLRAAEAEQAAARADSTAARHQIDAALSRVARAEQLAASTRQLGTATRNRLDAEYDALLRNAGSTLAMNTDSPVSLAVDVLEKITELELQIVSADTAARLARAELWRYADLQFHLSPRQP